MSFVRGLKDTVSKEVLRRRFGHEDFRRIRFVWGDVWKEWYAENGASSKDRLQRLKAGLDAESCTHIDNLFERYVFVTPRQKYSAYFICDERLIFTAEERLAQRRIQAEFSEATAKQQFPLPIDYYPPAIFHYDDGLAFLSPQQRERLRGTDFIDGGAWIGDSALVFTKYQPARIFCFEPIEANHKLLLETIRLNPKHNLIAVRAGLGEGDGELELFGNLTDASISPEVLNVNGDADRQKHEVIQVTSIDSYVPQHDVRPGLIKLDIESAEMDALHGSVNTIRKFRPVLIVSIYHTPREFFGAKPFIEDLGLGYTFSVRRLDVFHPTTETVLIATPAEAGHGCR
jgi:FkbM family methyltransferase